MLSVKEAPPPQATPAPTAPPPVQPARATINGQPVEFEQGATILTALRSLGLDVPTACHDDRLKPYGGCRVCAVTVKGFNRPVTACNTPISAGMEIQTHTPELESQRRTLLKL